MITDFMYIKAEHEKIYINALAHAHEVLSVASQTVLLHILGSRGSHIFLQIDHEVISKVILTPSAAQLQTFKNMTFFKMSKYDIRSDFECQNRILNVKVQYSASV